MRPILSLLLFLPFLLGAAPVKRPERIVSLNLCADQYLMALADPSQIAALTNYARDPQMSAAAAQAAKLPVSRGSAEEVLALRPDLIIASPSRRRETMEQLRGRQIATLDLPSAESHADVVAQIRLVANSVGHPERGEKLIADMAEALRRIPENAGKGRVAAYYQRRGYLTGTGTLVDDMMQRVGLRNLAAVLNKPALARISLEEMALARPDYLIVEAASEKVADQGTEMLYHPVIGAIPRLKIPQAWTVCGGPAYPAAIRSLSEQLRNPL